MNGNAPFLRSAVPPDATQVDETSVADRLIALALRRKERSGRVQPSRAFLQIARGAIQTFWILRPSRIVVSARLDRPGQARFAGFLLDTHRAN